jgi:uncharacterized membrane protein YagU involved in acid resistance
MERPRERQNEAQRREQPSTSGDGQLTLLEEMVAGAVGGLVGGLVMTGAMTMGEKMGIVERPLPLRVERWAEEQAGMAAETSAEQEKLLGQGMHLVYSGLLGAGYGALRSALDASAIPSGPLYGLSVYALNLGAVLPALDLTKGPWQEEPTTAGRRLMMHLAFGMAAGLVSEKVRARMADQG